MINYYDGILLEDNLKFLPWDSEVNELAEEFNIEILYKGDRTIYKWGTHKILNGLTLFLTSRYWNFLDVESKPILDNIEFWSIDNAIENDQKIYSHLVANFGEPNRDEIINNGDKIREWVIGNTKIILHLFEMHSYRLSLKLNKINVTA